MTEREKMLNGEWYDTSDPWLVSQRNMARDVSEQYNRTSENEKEMHRSILKGLLGSIGEKSEAKRS